MFRNRQSAPWHARGRKWQSMGRLCWRPPQKEKRPGNVWGSSFNRDIQYVKRKHLASSIVAPSKRICIFYVNFAANLHIGLLNHDDYFFLSLRFLSAFSKWTASRQSCLFYLENIFQLLGSVFYVRKDEQCPRMWKLLGSPVRFHNQSEVGDTSEMPLSSGNWIYGLLTLC